MSRNLDPQEEPAQTSPMEEGTQFLSGKVLIAMPGMEDPRFSHALVYLCAHSEDGAMGLIVNKPTDDLVWHDIFKKLDIALAHGEAPRPVNYGGPVETGRGFVLHSSDYHAESASLRVDSGTSMTATLDVLQAIASGHGPAQALVTLGYSGWAPGQLEKELQFNGWLSCDPDDDLLYGAEDETKWTRALAKLGIDPTLLGSGGHA